MLSLSLIKITVITIIMSSLGRVILGKTQTTLPTSRATITVTAATTETYLLNARKKCECGQTVNHKLYFD